MLLLETGLNTNEVSHNNPHVILSVSEGSHNTEKLCDSSGLYPQNDMQKGARRCLPANYYRELTFSKISASLKRTLIFLYGAII